MIEDFFEIRLVVKNNVVLTIVFGVPWPKKTNKEKGNRKNKVRCPIFAYKNQ